MNLNFSPLKERITHKERMSYLNDSSGASVLKTALFGLVTFLIIGLIFLLNQQNNQSSEQDVSLTSGIVGIAITGIGMYVVALKIKLDSKIRLQKFAKTNDLDVYAGPLVEPREGVLFNYGKARYYEIQLKSRNANYEWGNFKYSVGVSRFSLRGRHGYVFVKLNRPLPNMFFYSKLNKHWALEQYPFLPVDKLSVSLGSQFDQVFTTFVSDSQGQEAAELMDHHTLQLLVNHAEKYDFEIINGELYLYGMSFNLRHPKPINDMLQVAEAIASKLNNPVVSENYLEEGVSGLTNSQLILPKKKPHMPLAGRIMFGTMVFVIVCVIVLMILEPFIAN